MPEKTETTEAFITLAQAYVPPLLSGDYIVSAQVVSEKLGNSHTLSERLRVEGPRFSFLPEEIECVYPPAQSSGGYGMTLPHVTFRRKTLLWERSENLAELLKAAGVPPGGDAEKSLSKPLDATPWLCLLLLCGDEILAPVPCQVSELLQTPDKTFFPPLTPEAHERTQMCRYIDIDRERFFEIAPLSEELPLLCHARQIPLAQKCDSYANGQAYTWNCTTVCNRLPMSTREGVPCRAYVVSLEGYLRYDRDEAVKSADVLRLVVLHSWDFTCITAQKDMLSALKELSVARFALTAPPNTPPLLETLLQNAYIPLRHELRDGGSTVSFYRGPFAPNEPSRTKADNSAECADALYRYDPETGLFNISLATAWQTGRTLALANRPIAIKLMRKRLENFKAAHKERLNDQVRANLSFDAANRSGGSLEEALLMRLDTLFAENEGWPML